MLHNFLAIKHFESEYFCKLWEIRTLGIDFLVRANGERKSSW